jgi:hypothetical protein
MRNFPANHVWLPQGTRTVWEYHLEHGDISFHDMSIARSIMLEMSVKTSTSRIQPQQNYRWMGWMMACREIFQFAIQTRSLLRSFPCGLPYSLAN